MAKVIIPANYETKAPNEMNQGDIGIIITSQLDGLYVGEVVMRGGHHLFSLNTPNYWRLSDIKNLELIEFSISVFPKGSVIELIQE